MFVFRSLVVIAFLFHSESVAARSDGVQSFGCTGCHGAGDYTLDLEFAPDDFDPGETVTLSLRVSGPDGESFGFYLGASDGEFLPTNGASGSSVGIAHTSPISYDDEGLFSVQWVAPEEPGPVRFEFSTVIANGNGDRNGDFADEAVFERVFGCDEGIFFRDFDNDGFGSPDSTELGCLGGTPPVGTVVNSEDCDDFDDQQNPDATERCNQEDDDCDDEIDEDSERLTLYRDADDDGFYSAEERQNGLPIEGCVEPGFAAVGGDCAPNDATRNPGAEEICNRLDDDCDGRVDERVLPVCGVGLCRREAADCEGNFCEPGAPLEEECNGLDDDCDGETDESGCPVGSSCFDAECVSDEESSAPPAGGAGENPTGSNEGCTTVWPGILIGIARRDRSTRGTSQET
ncbi:MAG: putative metal-binding motif-containing protein [Myxococcota bacterium]